MSSKYFWRFIGFLLLVLLAVFVNKVGRSEENVQQMQTEEASVPVPADEEFQIMEYRTMPYEVGKEISKLSGWEIKIIRPTKEESWGEIKIEAKKLEATCLIKIQEVEAVYLFEDQILSGYLFIVNAYPQCPEIPKEKEGLGNK